MNAKEIIRKEQNAYIKEWRSRNPNKVKEYNSRSWLKRAEKRLAESENKYQLCW